MPSMWSICVRPSTGMTTLARFGQSVAQLPQTVLHKGANSTNSALDLRLRPLRTAPAGPQRVFARRSSVSASGLGGGVMAAFSRARAIELSR